MSPNRTAGGGVGRSSGKRSSYQRESAADQRGSGKRCARKRENCWSAPSRTAWRAAGRRVHLRQRQNTLKRMLIHVGPFNLSLIMRQSLGYGTPRGLTSALSRLLALYCSLHHLQRIRNHLRTMLPLSI